MPHVFISYVREDYDRIKVLAEELQCAGIDVWVDRDRISPGENWREAIRSAIANGAFFLACFSVHSVNREKSYANAELFLAIEQIRQRPWGSKWFLPILLDNCQVPDVGITANLSLRDIQWIDFPSLGWKSAVSSIVDTIHGGSKREVIAEPGVGAVGSVGVAEMQVVASAASPGVGEDEETSELKAEYARTTDEKSWQLNGVDSQALSLKEELFLLSVSAEKANEFSAYAFSGAVLAELVLSGRVKLEMDPSGFWAILENQIIDGIVREELIGSGGFCATVVNSVPLDDYFLDTALRRLERVSRPGRKAWLGKRGKYLDLTHVTRNYRHDWRAEEYISHLIQRGVLHVVRKKGFLRSEIIHVVPLRRQEELKERFVQRVNAGIVPSDRDAVIAVLGEASEGSGISAETWSKAAELASSNRLAELLRKLKDYAVKNDDDYDPQDASWAGAS
jgi:hypothetical protein